MEPQNLTYDQQQHVESHAPYMKIFYALLVLTILEYFYAKVFAGSTVTLVLGLLLLAGVKAGLVGAYFMHVKFEGRWVYFMIVPACILAAVLVLALIPDIGMQPVGSDSEDEVQAAPMMPGPATSLRA